MFRSSRQPEAYDTHQLALHLAIEERLSQAVEKAYHIQQLTAAKDSFTEILGFVSHELKNMGSFAKPMTPNERKIWQELVDESFERFKSIIRTTFQQTAHWRC